MLTLALLTGLAAPALLASELPRAVAWPSALLALFHGSRLLWREATRPRRMFAIRASGRVEVDGTAVDDFRVAWRGPLAFASWAERDGRLRRASWWPDTLPAAARRELRLAMPPEGGAGPAETMAP